MFLAIMLRFFFNIFLLKKNALSLSVVMFGLTFTLEVMAGAINPMHLQMWQVTSWGRKWRKVRTVYHLEGKPIPKIAVNKVQDSSILGT